MTTEPRDMPESQPKPKTVKKVDPASDSRLAALLTEFARASEEAKDAKARADEYQSEIKAIIFEDTGTSIPDSFSIAADPHGGYPAYNFYYTAPGWSIDSKTMKETEPETYVQWAKPTRGYWTFKERTQGGGRRK